MSNEPRWGEFYKAEAEYAQFNPQRDPLEMSRVNLVMRLWPRGVHSALDVGCGDGFLCSEWARRRAASVIAGAEYVPARAQRAQAAVPGGLFSIQRAEQLGIADRRFDLVSLVETLEHLEEPERVLREVARVSRRYVIVTVPYKEDLEVHRYVCPYCLNRFHAAGHLSVFDEARLAKLFEQAGLRLVRMRIQCYLRVCEQHPLLTWIPVPVIEQLKEWARRADLIQGMYVGALGERMDV